MHKKSHKKYLINIGKTLSILILEFLTGYAFSLAGLTEIHIFTVYVLGILVTAIVTASISCSMLSVCGIFIFNYFFAEPMFSFYAYHIGYPITFLILLAAAVMTGTLARKNEQRAKKLAQTAYRNQVVLETSQLLQKAKCKQDIIEVTAYRLMKILDKNILVFPEEQGELRSPQIFLMGERDKLSFELNDTEKGTAFWTFLHNKCAGAGTNMYSNAKGTYLPIHTAAQSYGVIGIDLEGQEFASDETNLVLGECALAFEREYYNERREEAAVQAKNEKLRSDLLRSISHDLRTPLTGISGNAALLSEQGELLTKEKRKMLSQSIWNDANWLISMVENLLSITKLEEIEKDITMQPELLEDILLDSVNYAKKQHPTHHFLLEPGNEVQIVQCNAQLILQVMRNILENAVKYTPAGTNVTIRTRQDKEQILVEVADEGKGVADDVKIHIFEMFYTTGGSVCDKGRGFGIGLALCKAIIAAHGGEIRVIDALPHGAVFQFSLKKARIIIHDETEPSDCGR